MKDYRNIIILSLIILVTAIVFLVFVVGKNQQIPTANSEYPKQENQEAEVTVEVTPLKLSSKEDTGFAIVLNTHSVNLDMSLKDMSVLEDDKGNIYNPISWSGETGGHHAEGKLIFPPFSKDAKFVKLTIKQIGGVDRIFKWDLK